MENNINFRGAIILKQPTADIQRKMLKVIGKHHQVFKNFTQEGDVLYITRKGADKNVAEFLTHHRTKYEFYPDLSTKSGFDDEKPEEAREIIKNSNSIFLKTKNELCDFFKLKELKPLFSRKRKDNPVELSVKALGLEEKNQIIKKRNGYSEVKSSDGKLLARISGPGQYGISFAFVEPKNADSSPRRFAVRGGEIIFEYTSESGRAQFLKNYNCAVKANKFVPKTEATHI